MDKPLSWRRSSYSTANGGACVEVAWCRSSYSGSNGGDCVEVGRRDHRTGVRDSSPRTPAPSGSPPPPGGPSSPPCADPPQRGAGNRTAISATASMVAPSGAPLAGSASAMTVVAARRSEW